jgi:hypothetical protein
MSLLYIGGTSEKLSELHLLLKDNLDSMGSAITKSHGTLAWCESMAIAKCQMASLNYLRLLSNQLTPSQMSVFARRYADIFALPAHGTNPIPSNLSSLQEQISLEYALFGTPNSLSNVQTYIEGVLGSIYIDLEFAPEIQNLASGNSQPLGGDNFWFSPLSNIYVREWQPRDNKDNLLMPTNTFLTTCDAYKQFVKEWLPAYAGLMNMQLIYPGNDGYGIDSYGVNTLPSAIDPTVQYGSQNTISAVAGGNTIFGNGGCTFTKDFPTTFLYGWPAPIEVVDDNNLIQTYIVTNIVNDNQIDIQGTIINNITARSYRLLGIEMDTNYVLDNSLFNI